MQPPETEVPVAKEEPSEKFELGKYTVIVAPVLVFFGVCRLVLYYIRFNINIINFLDFSEILTSFFDVLIFVLVTLSSYSLMLYLAQDHANYVAKKPKKIFGKESTKLRMALHPKSWNWLGTFYFLLGFGLLYFSILVVSLFTGDYPAIIGLYLAAAYFPILYYIDLKASGKKINKLNQFYFLSTYLIMVTMLFLTVITYVDVHEVKKDARFYGVTIRLSNNDSIISDSTNYYIGNTRNFVFVYNAKKDATSVFKIEDVQSLEFPKRREIPAYGSNPSTPLPSKPPK
jgi:hypothetical protein